MTAVKKQILVKDIYQINAGVENGINDEIKIPCPDVNSYNSWFFRMQYCIENPIDINEQPTNEILHTDIQFPIEKSKIRSSSPLTSIARWIDETEFSTAIKDRPSLPITHSSSGRKKSNSLRLTHHDETQLCPKKAVRFADDFGLELSQMKLINTDELPRVPIEAFKHLQINSEYRQSDSERMKVIASMQAQFDGPMYTPDFNDRVSRDKIVLEQANAIDNRIYGTIRLISLGLHKRVKVHITTDNWISFEDYDAGYINNSYDGHCDRFSFTIEIARHRICIGNNIQFCLCYQSFDGVEYWDNNYQQNYRFDCSSRTIPDYVTPIENRFP